MVLIQALNTIGITSFKESNYKSSFRTVGPKVEGSSPFGLVREEKPRKQCSTILDSAGKDLCKLFSCCHYVHSTEFNAFQTGYIISQLLDFSNFAFKYYHLKAIIVIQMHVGRRNYL